MTHARPRGPFTTAFSPTFRGWGGKKTASRPQPRRGSRVAAAHLHCPMISSKACRCSRSRRRSSAAMCRFHGGKPAARSPDAISAARREGAAGASARPAPRRAAEGRRRRAGRRRRPVPGPRRGKCGGEERPLRIGARHAATAPRPPWRCGRALSGALAPQRRTAMATEAAPTLPDTPLPPASTAASHTALAPQHQAAPRRGRSASTVPASPTRRAGTLLRRGASRRAILWPPPGSAFARCRHFESGKPHHPARAAILRGLYPPLQRRMRVSPVAPLGGGGGCGACHDRFSRYRGVSPTPGCLRGPRHPLCRPK